MSRLQTGTQNIRFSRLSAVLLLLLPQWMTSARKSDIRWNMEIVPPTLSTHQRLIMRVIVRVDGRDLEKRRGAGDFITLLQFRDSEGHVWETHASLNLATMQPGMQARDLEVSLYAFVLPGDYTMSVAVCDPAAEDHNFRTHRVHVRALKSEPLPNAWSGLPPVEFIESPSGPPDLWFLPDVKGNLNLPVATKRPVHVELLVNTTPSERTVGSVAALRRNMSLLIPALKMLSGVRLDVGSVDAALLDLTHRRVVYEQHDIHELNWTSMRRFFLETNPGVIDVHALENQSWMRQYFADEIARRMAAADDRPLVIIVLSGPGFFEYQSAFNLRVFPESPNRRLIYIRDRFVGQGMRMRPRPGMRPIAAQPLSTYMPIDDLERAVEPLHPHIYDAASSEQFRRILSAVLDQISAM